MFKYGLFLEKSKAILEKYSNLVTINFETNKKIKTDQLRSMFCETVQNYMEYHNLNAQHCYRGSY